ncbi:MAG: hypothetical protein ACO3L0_03000, partial [Vulcanococcus sp.]
MDITLTSVGESYNLKHRTVMGMLWLQTHFADETWDLICSGQVNLNRQSSESLTTTPLPQGSACPCSRALSAP